MKTGIKIVLWIGVALLAYWAMQGSPEESHSDPAGRGLVQAVSILFGVIAAAAALALLLGQRWRGWLWVGGAILLPTYLWIGSIAIEQMNWSAQKGRKDADEHSGRLYFSEQPALLAVASAIDRNDEDAIRAAVKNVPDLQATTRLGWTLLTFAVFEAQDRPQLVKAVATLLSCGADPNYNNVMVYGLGGDMRLLRTLLDAGGNPNGTDGQGAPIIFELLFPTQYSKGDRRERLRLLLDRGADVNSTRPDRGYTLLMLLASLGKDEPVAYTDALDLLERGADFNRTAQDQTNLVKILAEHRREWSTKGKAAPPEYEKLCDWLRQRGAIVGDT